MIARFIGKLNWAPQNPLEPDLWQLEEPFGFLTNSNYLIVCSPWRRTDGASIPKFLWWLLGHPFDSENKFWSVPHDAGYNRWAIVINLNHESIRHFTPEQLIYKPNNVIDAIIPLQTISRLVWDNWAHESMIVLSESKWKQRIVYRALRLFGKRAWKKAHERTSTYI